MITFFSAAAAFLAGLIKTTFGVGAGVFLTPLLSINMDPKTAVALMAPMMLFSDLSTIGLHWKKWDVSHIKILIPGGVIGVFIGSYYLAWASLSITQVTIGIVAMVFSSLQIVRQQKSEYFTNLNMKPAHGALISVLAGAASAVAHSGGIVISIYLVTLGLAKQAFVATLILFLFAGDILKMALFAKLGILNSEILIVGLLLTPALFLGSWFGSKLINKLTDHQFIFIVNIFIFLSGLFLIIKNYC
ncbi:hypothetical protein SAMN05660649_04514 [Desulfotomaculum arcticum]|uniref:Probable membrane transporter protein n=1 Tax=Desulfotruncus arcticus DSM 17038 TaxID=1121424 RepID=A0A1I2YRA9_9FIRM|nr:sulfite exporter TauE/SafE family protein [Desulfotruncus arcticus]SFH27161.1 hypothetical protein SAMN05660649_04514 [Desulfotomaculum arcticum] [Desulfotruncus arcticus DSM 17038]